MNILNHFKKKYFVLHDTNVQKTYRRKTKKDDEQREYIERQEIKNPAWTNNTKIKDAMTEFSTVVASVTNFETAYFSEAIEGGRPANAIEKIKEEDHYKTVKELLGSILNDTELPKNAVRWTEIEDLEKVVGDFSSVHVEEV